MFWRRSSNQIMASLAYFRHLGLVFLILQSAILYSRRQNRPARQLRYLTSSAIPPDGEEDARLSKFEIRQPQGRSTSAVPNIQGRSFSLRNKRASRLTCQVYGVATSGINSKKLLW